MDLSLLGGSIYYTISYYDAIEEEIKIVSIDDVGTSGFNFTAE